MSARLHTLCAEPTISAPADWYSSSEKAERSPAWVSTRTVWLASTSAFTPAGVMPTRDSWSFTSLGTPIIIENLPSLVNASKWGRFTPRRRAFDTRGNAGRPFVIPKRSGGICSFYPPRFAQVSPGWVCLLDELDFLCAGPPLDFFFTAKSVVD